MRRSLLGFVSDLLDRAEGKTEPTITQQPSAEKLALQAFLKQMQVSQQRKQEQEAKTKINKVEEEVVELPPVDVEEKLTKNKRKILF